MMKYFALLLSPKPPLLVLLLCVFSCFLAKTAQAKDGEETNSGASFSSFCDSNAISSDIPLRQLTPNTFYKICPSFSSVNNNNNKKYSLGSHPVCGDGTAFSFYVTRPIQRKDDQRKILIEISGGGACWSTNTCQNVQDRLTFPSEWDSALGYSCSELQAAVASGRAVFGGGEGGGQQQSAINFLCAQQLGTTDFTSYTTIYMPYCTQDVNTGDNSITYNDGSTVHHTGGHNLMAVLRYIYKNFPNPSHIILTGCSAGATVLPIAYSLLHQHYTHFGGMVARKTQISVLADSPVYLTPITFLEKYYDNWNPWTVLKRIGFRYDKWRHNTQFSSQLLEYILRQGSNSDQWGFVTHEYDPVSLYYYEAMSGVYDNGNDDDDNDNGQRRRWLEQDELADEWWTNVSADLVAHTSKHKNVHTFIIDDEEGHCSFGLYYAQQHEEFEAWASDILVQQNVVVGGGHRSMLSFLFCSLVGVLFAYGSLYSSRVKKQTNASDTSTKSTDEYFLKHEDDTTSSASSWKQSLRASALAFLNRFAEYPITASYTVAASVYFWTMIAREGLTHPLNNPSIGPTAIGLSAFGINNPSLIVYQFQLSRLASSALLFSGILAYLLALPCLWFYNRPLERHIGSKHFGILLGLILLGSNLLYSVLGNGATCSALALLLGLNAFWISFATKMNGSKCGATTFTIFLALLLSLVFTFNSWIIIAAAMGLGLVFAFILFDSKDEEGLEREETQQENVNKQQLVLRRNRLYSILGTYAFLFFLLLCRFHRPNRLYQEPFYTGCDLKYSDSIDDFVSQFSSNGDGRRLEDGNNDNDGATLCAQFCIPHLVSKGITYGARRVFDFPIRDGTCDENGYGDHIADKTFKQLSYSLDVEIYQNYN